MSLESTSPWFREFSSAINSLLVIAFNIVLTCSDNLIYNNEICINSLGNIIDLGSNNSILLKFKSKLKIK